MNLIIVESPGKIKKIREYVGDGFEVMASYGHIRDLEVSPASGLTGIDPPDFIPKYVPTERGKSVISNLKAAVKKADVIYIATDLDREGEAIAWHLKDALNLKTYQRITFSEITKPAIDASFKAARQIDVNLVKAQEARRFIDRHVGYLVSPFLSNTTGQNLSAGRVQSIAVMVVVEREKAIADFTHSVVYGLKAQFDGWSASLIPTMRDERRQPLELLAEATQSLSVIECSTKQKLRNPPPALITSTLQKAGFVQLGFDPDITMKLAQSLYEKGLITYMRTDALNISPTAFFELCGAGIALGHIAVLKQRVWPSKEGAQEAHEAIRPSDFLMTPDKAASDLSDDESRLYSIIWTTAFCSQMPPAEYEVKRILLSAGKRWDGDDYVLSAVSRTLIEPGWLAIMPGDLSEEKEKDTKDDDPEVTDNVLPALAAGDFVNCDALSVYDIKAKPPGLHTRVSLITALEKMGVGRPATYAAILKNILGRGYVQETNKKKLVGSESGRLIVSSLKGKFDFMAHEYTRDMETLLDDVAAGTGDFNGLVSKSYFDLKKTIDAVVPTHPCPACKKPLRLFAKFSVWVCTDRDNCKCRVPDNKGVPGAQIVHEVASVPCPDCGSPLHHRIKADQGATKGYDFWGCSGFPKCKSSFANVDGQPKLNKSK